MNRREAGAMLRILQSRYPDWRVVDSLIALPPVRPLLRGCYVEGSSFDKYSFYVWVFVLPLYVPMDDLMFTLGFRLRRRHGGDRWDSRESADTYLLEAFETQALPLLSGVASPLDVPKVAAKLKADRNPHAQMMIALSFARTGHHAEALAAAKALQHSLDVTVPWQRQLGHDAETLTKDLIDDAKSVASTLEALEAKQLRKLKLERLET